MFIPEWLIFILTNVCIDNMIDDGFRLKCLAIARKSLRSNINGPTIIKSPKLPYYSQLPNHNLFPSLYMKYYPCPHHGKAWLVLSYWHHKVMRIEFTESTGCVTSSYHNVCVTDGMFRHYFITDILLLLLVKCICCWRYHSTVTIIVVITVIVMVKVAFRPLHYDNYHFTVFPYTTVLNACEIFKEIYVNCDGWRPKCMWDKM